MTSPCYYMMTSSNGNIFRVTGPLCGEFTGPGEFPTQRPVTRSFDVFFDLRLNKRLSKQSWGWWFETLSCPLWRHGNVSVLFVLRNTLNPVYGVAILCHQFRCIRWGYPILFYTAASLSSWYKTVCMRKMVYRLRGMKFINILSMYVQSGTHMHFNW